MADLMCPSLAGLDIGGLSEDPSVSAHPSGPARGTRPLQEEPLDAILSPELDKMVTDGEDHQSQTLSPLVSLSWLASTWHVFKWIPDKCPQAVCAN